MLLEQYGEHHIGNSCRVYCNRQDKILWNPQRVLWVGVEVFCTSVT